MQNNKLISDEDVLTLIKAAIFVSNYEIFDSDKVSKGIKKDIAKISNKLDDSLDDLSGKYADKTDEEKATIFLTMLNTLEEWYLQSKDLEG